MEQTVYDDAASVLVKKLSRKFSKKYTEKFDGIQILRKLSTRLYRRRSKESEKTKQEGLSPKKSITKTNLTRRMTIDKEFVNGQRIDKLTLGENYPEKIIDRRATTNYSQLRKHATQL